MARWQPVASMVTTAPSNRRQFEQRRNGDDFVGLGADFGLTQHHALASGEGGDDVDRLFGALLPIGTSNGLSIDGDHFGLLVRQRRRPGGETALKRGRIQLGEDYAQLIMRRRAVSKGPKPPQ